MASTSDLRRLFLYNALGLSAEQGARLSISDLENKFASSGGRGRNIAGDELVRIPTPVGFPGLRKIPTPGIYYNGRTGRYETDLDINSLRPKMKNIRYVSPTGGGTGLTPESPTTYSSIHLDSSIDTVYFLPGVYSRGYAGISSSSLLNFDRSYIAYAPGVRLAPYNSGHTWVLHSGAIYRTSRSSVVQVYDDRGQFSTDGFIKRYTKKNTLVEVTGPGEWFTDNVNVYVWAFDDLDLTTPAGKDTIRLAMEATNGIYHSGGRVYVEGIDFEAGSLGRPIAMRGDGVLITVDCKIRYAFGNGVTILGGLYIGIRTDASMCGQDGFNYHESLGPTVDFIEIDCSSRRNGWNPEVVNTNNASTAHESTRGLRINGVYEDSNGPLIADVNSSQTWSIGCVTKRVRPEVTVSDSQANHYHTTGPVNVGDIPASMWIQDVKAEGSGRFAKAQSGGKIYLKDEKYNTPETFSIDATSTIGRF